ARAIENGAFVIAAGQCGSPYPGRHDYGHSLIVDPWGRVLAEAGDQPAVIVAELRLTEIAKCRQAVPSLSQDQTIRVVQS
ncbi:MAG: nitrilase-related carbon-nitrogen hydrolase, partial [Steroidobacteraceae bacterium]